MDTSNIIMMIVIGTIVKFPTGSSCKAVYPFYDDSLVNGTLVFFLSNGTLQ